jgi:hypothetical protein
MAAVLILDIWSDTAEARLLQVVKVRPELQLLDCSIAQFYYCEES